MDYMQYSQDFQINSYFNSLPPYARQTILEAYGEITTLGELKKCAESYYEQRAVLAPYSITVRFRVNK